MNKHTTGKKPRWAAQLTDTVWARLNDLLRDGWDNKDIVRELSLPESKLRSLQVYARKFGPRRRLQLFADFKDALLGQLTSSSPEIMQGLQQIVAMTVSPSVKESTQLRAGALMMDLVGKVSAMMQDDTASEHQRRQQEGGHREADPQQVVGQILDVLGIGHVDQSAGLSVSGQDPATGEGGHG